LVGFFSSSDEDSTTLLVFFNGTLISSDEEIEPFLALGLTISSDEDSTTFFSFLCGFFLMTIGSHEEEDFSSDFVDFPGMFCFRSETQLKFQILFYSLKHHE
jgi:hypothetical protein